MRAVHLRRYTWSEVLQFLRIFGPPRAICSPTTTSSPTMTDDVIRRGKDGRRELVPMRWGLIPAWGAKSLRETPATFNARAESVADKPMFRDAFKGQRCIIPASGFYEWTGEKGNKQPHPFTAAGAPLFLPLCRFLWDPLGRDHAAGEDVLSCTIIVCGANKWMQAYHDRMPVILDEKDFDGWLDGSRVLAPSNALVGMDLRFVNGLCAQSRSA